MTNEDLKRMRWLVAAQQSRDLTDKELADLEELMDELDDEEDDNVTSLPDDDPE